MSEILSAIFTLNNVLMMFIGVFAGIIIGVLPGLGTTFAVTVLLTITFGMDSYAGMYLLLGAYVGSVYGGSITAILINTPGTNSAVATAFDGYPLAEKGRAGDALNAALFASTVGGLVSAFALMFFAPQLAKVVNLIASPEYFCLCIFGLCAAVSVAGDNRIKGLICACFGLLIASVGMDPAFGTNRFTFGYYRLLGGFRVSTVMLGAYAMSTVLIKCREAYISGTKGAEPIEFHHSKFRLHHTFRYWKTLIRSSVYGVVIGAIPGTGSAISAMLGYNAARRASKNPDEWGKGELEGVVAPECANNAVTGATMIPLLTMGIPGDAATAVLLGALTMQGVIPGKALFSEGSVWVYAIMGGLIIVNLIMLLQGSLLIHLFANVTRVPLTVLMPCIVATCFMGAYALGNSTYEIMVMIAFGMLGYIMKRFDFPIPPLTIALVLGSLCESNLRRSLLVSHDDWTVFFTRPVCILILLLAVAFMMLPTINKWLQEKKVFKKLDIESVETVE